MTRSSADKPRDAFVQTNFACVIVRLSVCHARVLYPDGWRYRQTSFSAR